MLSADLDEILSESYILPPEKKYLSGKNIKWVFLRIPLIMLMFKTSSNFPPLWESGMLFAAPQDGALVEKRLLQVLGARRCVFADAELIKSG